MCGEHSVPGISLCNHTGSSPHVRGALRMRTWDYVPARDHPRMCGEHNMVKYTVCKSGGSSPHVRGAPCIMTPKPLSKGIIPACAGSTHTMQALRSIPGDHPRMCGEHPPSCSMLMVVLGSSPHVRGALIQDDVPAYVRGIIPACAGST